MNIFFRELGEGTPILFIHGFCETHEIWDGFDEKLSSYGRVISIDLPGFGKSPLPAEPLSIDLIAGNLLDWLKEKQIERPVLVGHSLGGYVALAMAAKDPACCDKLVLLHSSVYADSDEKKANRDKVIDFVTKNGVEPFIQTFVPSLFYNKIHPAIERVRSITIKTPLTTLVAYTKAMRDRPSREDFFKRHPNQTLVIAGEKDEIIPLEVSKKMASISSKTIFFALPDTGHMGMIESEDEAVEKIRDFILDL
jgi:pimeloyl-ACP methyl ester carboxylesterase